MKILFFDIELTGHHSEYIDHLVNYLSMNPNDNIYYFIINPSFSENFPEIAAKTQRISNIYWIEVKKEEYDNCKKGSLIRRSFIYLKLVNKYAKDLSVEHVILLYFNIFQLALGIFRPHYLISGILFLQFFRQSKKTMKEKLRYYRKYLQTYLYSRNRKIKNIYILNDHKTVAYLNKEFKTNMFEILYDPIPILSPLSGFDLRKEYNICPEKKIYLHIGTLNERKGTLDIIDSLQYISASKQKTICIILAGKASDDFIPILTNKIESVKQYDVQLIWINEFVSNYKMKSLFDQCDYVLIPYKNTEASSGVLGHAIAANKTIISTKSGLLEEIISINNFGILVAQVTPMIIAQAIENCDSIVFSKENARRFITKRTPNHFAEKIINFTQCY